MWWSSPTLHKHICFLPSLTFLFDCFFQTKAFLPAVSIVKWLILGEQTLDAVCASGGGHLHWHLWNGLPDRVWWCLAHGSSKGRDRGILYAALGGDSHWLPCGCHEHVEQLQITRGTRDHLFCVPQDCALRCMFSLDNIRQYLKAISVASMEKEKLCLPKAPSS